MMEVKGLVDSLKAVVYGNNSTSKPSSFHLFPQLPAELRRQIFSAALEERIIEARLYFRNGVWHYLCEKPVEKLDARKLPALFSVNTESRELCREQYILFAGHYIHPKVDVLYISWFPYPIRANGVPKPSSPIDGRPFENFMNIVISAAQNPNFPKRFGPIMECIKSLGSPQEISIGLDGPKLPRMFSDLRGYSTATGQQVIVLTWQTDTSFTAQKSLQDEVIDAFALEERVICGLKLPKIKQRMLYIYSGP